MSRCLQRGIWSQQSSWCRLMFQECKKKTIGEYEYSRIISDCDNHKFISKFSLVDRYRVRWLKVIANDNNNYNNYNNYNNNYCNNYNNIIVIIIIIIVIKVENQHSQCSYSVNGKSKHHHIANAIVNFFACILFPVFLDLPGPWDAIQSSKEALKVSQ